MTIAVAYTTEAVVNQNIAWKKSVRVTFEKCLVDDLNNANQISLSVALNPTKLKTWSLFLLLMSQILQDDITI